ncbi:hypothetical protein ONQ97_27215, partial [Salmonella enterica subsp. enterica serovar Virginia]|nr:hypothetical protein [Salmonella enterica subsp. enterica serovar Virginia]
FAANPDKVAARPSASAADFGARVAPGRTVPCAFAAARLPAAAPKAAPITRAPEAPKATAEKKDERRWMVQCGSFKGAEQAESV